MRKAKYMPVMEPTLQAPTPPSPRTEQVRALAVILREEFSVPFVFYDAATGEPAWDAEGMDGERCRFWIYPSWRSCGPAAGRGPSCSATAAFT